MKKFTFFYFFILLDDLICRALQNDWLIAEHILKPILMSLLGIYFFQSVILRGVKQHQFVLAAIVFSWIGDIFLMYDGYFIQGLAAFLIAHIFYILAFRPEASRFFSRKETLIPATIVLIYGGLLLSIVLPNVSSALKIPIIIYSLTILIMLLTVLHCYGNVSAVSFKYMIIGASLFVLSDSLIAVSKFVTSFPMDGVLIMATYGVGQYLIVDGYLENVKKQMVDN